MYMTIIFKFLILGFCLVNQNQILYVASLGKGNKKNIHFLGHMAKMAATTIYGKEIKSLYLQNQGPEVYKVYINDYPLLTLTNLTAMLN